MRIQEILLHRIRLPLTKPYNTALGAFSEFETIVGEIRDTDGRWGVGETTIIPGYAFETVDGGWRFCLEQSERLLGQPVENVSALLDPHRKCAPHAVSVLQIASEVLQGNAILAAPRQRTPVPILAPINSKRLEEIPAEIDDLIERGFRTLKVKVGWNVEADLDRVRLIQRHNYGRATLRLDANQGFNREQGTRFASRLDPAGIALFEQPCAADDWDSNAAVARVSPVPIMMDESIYVPDDIERAAQMEGCGFVKLKISKTTGVDLLKQGLDRIRELGMGPVLGNGAASDIGCWVEACVAAAACDRAGEMHGFLKNSVQLFARPLTFDNGSIMLEPDFAPELDRDALDRLTIARKRLTPTSVAASPKK